MKKKDLTLTELAKYDGTGEDGRVLVGVLGKIYDVTKGKRFYGPGTTYIVLHISLLYLAELLYLLFEKTAQYQAVWAAVSC